jgi:hypothetical protein
MAVNKPSTDSFKREIRQITEKEKEKGRSENYWQLSARDQWEEDNRLGLLDWDGE